MTAVRVIKMSGRWDRSPASLDAALDAATKDSDVITLTEVKDGRRPDALPRPRWTVSQDRDPWRLAECAILSRNDAWKRLHTETVVLHADIGQGGPIVAALTVLEDLEGRRLLVGESHLPSAVESAWRSAKARAHRAAVAAYRAKVKALTTKYHPDAVLVWADWNLDLHQLWVREWIAKAWPELKVPTVIPGGGTHAGGRLIDWPLYAGLTDLRWTILPANAASDHKPTQLTATISSRKEKPVSKPEIYPGADAKTQWHADDHPGVHFDANCGCLHTTEGTDWPSYSGGATAPNITFKPDFKNKRLVGRQHFPIDMSSRALKNLTGGVETNTLNVVQVELVGTCDPRHRETWNGLHAGIDYIYWPDAPEWALRDLAKFMTWCSVQHGVPLEGMKTWVAYPKSAGFGAAQRMSASEWRAFKGWCGHQHVPENDHGDPGDLPFAHLLELARGAAPARPVAKTRGDDIDAAIASLRHATPSKANAAKVKAALDSLLSIPAKAVIAEEV